MQFIPYALLKTFRCTSSVLLRDVAITVQPNADLQPCAVLHFSLTDRDKGGDHVKFMYYFKALQVHKVCEYLSYIKDNSAWGARHTIQ
jgi:hypothetical protein